MTVRDETPSGLTPDYWTVWDDYDYYGPYLQAVCRTREGAVAYIDQLPETVAYRRDHLFIEGGVFDD